MFGKGIISAHFKSKYSFLFSDDYDLILKYILFIIFTPHAHLLSIFDFYFWMASNNR